MAPVNSGSCICTEVSMTVKASSEASAARIKYFAIALVSNYVALGGGGAGEQGDGKAF